MTATGTFTKTYARLALVQTNVRAALRSLGWPSGIVTPLVDIGLASGNRYVSQFHTYGFVPGTERWQLHCWIEVDWDEHDRLVVTNSIVSVDDRWEDGRNPGLVEQADGFGRLLRECGLTPSYAFRFAQHLIDNESAKEAANHHMGLISSGLFSGIPDGPVEDAQSNRLAALTEVAYGSESAFPE